MKKKEAKFYDSKEFKRLQRQWYKKLKTSGFKDVEQFHPDTMEPREMLVSHAGCYSSIGDLRRKYNPETERYWELARAHYWTIHRKWSIDADLREGYRLWSHLAMGVNRVATAMGICNQRLRRFVKEQEAEFLPTTFPNPRSS